MNRQEPKELFSKKIVVKGKTLFVEAKKNKRGKYLQITELSNDKRSGVFIPVDNVDEFFDAMKETIKVLKS